MSDAPVQTIILPGTLESFRPQYAPHSLARSRVFTFGRVKSGKSRIQANNPGAFIIDAEDKIRAIPKPYVKAAGVYVPLSLGHLDAIFDWLLAQKKAHGDAFPVTTVVLDTIDEIISALVIPGLTDEKMSPSDIANGLDITDFGSKGKGWVMVTKRILVRLAELYQAGFGWWVNGHVKEERQTVRTGSGTQEIVKVRPAVPPSIYLGLIRAAELIGMTSLRTTEVPGPDREITLPSGQKKVIPGAPTTETVCVLNITEKAGDTETTGSNITLPSEVLLRQGHQWEELNAAYATAISAV